MATEVKIALAELNAEEPLPLIISGHSLGGALATLLAFDLAISSTRGQIAWTEWKFYERTIAAKGNVVSLKHVSLLLFGCLGVRITDRSERSPFYGDSFDVWIPQSWKRQVPKGVRFSCAAALACRAGTRHHHATSTAAVPTCRQAGSPYGCRCPLPRPHPPRHAHAAAEEHQHCLPSQG